MFVMMGMPRFSAVALNLVMKSRPVAPFGMSERFLEWPPKKKRLSSWNSTPMTSRHHSAAGSAFSTMVRTTAGSPFMSPPFMVS